VALVAEVSRLREALAEETEDAAQWLREEGIERKRAERAEADVSRLQQERDNLGILLKRGLDIMEEAKAERAKLLEENALLRRSLEMLTKQMAEPVYTPPAEVSPCPSSLKTSSRPNTPTIPMRSMAP
jgi:regulator of replication initiation timing